MIPEISVQEAQARLTGPQPPRLIDVRERDEWALVHVAGAELLPLSEWPGAATSALTDLDQPLLVLCHHGGRSAQATAYLQQQGFAATNVAGGIDAWAREVDPTLARY